MTEKLLDPLEGVLRLTKTGSVFLPRACSKHFCFFLVQYKHGGPPSHYKR